jgi:hypothetical protein
MPSRRFVVAVLAAVAIAAPVGIWIGDSGPDDPGRTDQWHGWTGYGPHGNDESTESNAGLIELRREGLTKILSGMREYGARPEQIANVERMLAALPG